MAELKEISKTQPPLDKEFFFAYLSEFLDGDLPNAPMHRFKALVKKAEFQTAAQNFRSQRGLLQVHIGKIVLNNDNIHELRLKARSDELEDVVEGAEIANVKNEEAPKTQLQRWLLAAVLLVVAAAFLYTYLAKTELSFDPVQALPYEALVMEEDKDLESLDLPSNDMRDVEAFFAKQQNLDFTPFLLQMPSDWHTQGASMIDYDTAKIGVTRYEDAEKKQTLFHFAFAGRLERLSPSTQGHLDHFIYQTYASDKMNLIVWQHNPKTLGMLVGHLSAEDLARIASHSELKN